MRSFTMTFITIIMDVIIIACALILKDTSLSTWFIIGMMTGMTIGVIVIDCAKFYIEKELNEKPLNEKPY